MCSPEGEGIDRLADAIDDLADAGADALTPEELAARIAGLWSIVEALDPEIARRRSLYDRPRSTD
ncbi:hypothetical protein DZF91_05565 [Actinomadura logoneensis]|uniref:Uncharacterized protein n=1 Tax=Actinomadura logoneensis TaxID=2293572 RepID=A0A372JRD2_9ACTN|nr:hypothetical protein [Actinomadura logoneensis]RFU42595.1 hypothetical protein DZF91_05565 [Actinomadura logoneensis]